MVRKPCICYQRQYSQRQRTLTIPYSGMRREEEENGERKGWGLHVTLATQVGVCIVPCVLVVLEDIKACWLWAVLHEKKNYNEIPVTSM